MRDCRKYRENWIREYMQETRLPDFKTELAREQTMMASERTFLSWIRTGLAVVGGGIVVVRFVQFDDPLEHLLVLIAGKSLILWGIAIFILSLFDFRRVYKHKKITMALSTNVFVTLLVISLVIISAVLLVFV